MRNKRQAQRELYDRFCYKLKGIALRYAPDEDEANDIVQESFIRAFDQLKNYEEQGNLGGWLHRITVNTALQQYRKQQTRKVHTEAAVAEQEGVSVNESIATMEMESLLQKIQSLPHGFRVVFNLYAIEGYTHKEIGEMLGISDGTSKSQYARAKKQLQQMILEEETNTKNRHHGS